MGSACKFQHLEAKLRAASNDYDWALEDNRLALANLLLVSPPVWPGVPICCRDARLGLRARRLPDCGMFFSFAECSCPSIATKRLHSALVGLQAQEKEFAADLRRPLQ